jgi:hypothetical protein
MAISDSKSNAYIRRRVISPSFSYYYKCKSSLLTHVSHHIGRVCRYHGRQTFIIIIIIIIIILVICNYLFISTVVFNALYTSYILIYSSFL